MRWAWRRGGHDRTACSPRICRMGGGQGLGGRRGTLGCQGGGALPPHTLCLALERQRTHHQSPPSHTSCRRAAPLIKQAVVDTLGGTKVPEIAANGQAWALHNLSEEVSGAGVTPPHPPQPGDGKLTEGSLDRHDTGLWHSPTPPITTHRACPVIGMRLSSGMRRSTLIREGRRRRRPRLQRKTMLETGPGCVWPAPGRCTSESSSVL